jgi:hypothetical protein
MTGPFSHNLLDGDERKERHSETKPTNKKKKERAN